MFKRLMSLVLAVVLTLSCGCGICVSAAEPEESLVYIPLAGKINYDYANSVLEILNEMRADLMLPALEMDASLTESAMLRAAEISLYFSHTRPNGNDCFTAIEYWEHTVGENIAIGQTGPAHVMESWTNSPGHYRNMMNSEFKSIGIGCFEASGGILCWVQLLSGGTAKGETKSGSATAEYNIEAADENLSLQIENQSGIHNMKNGKTANLKAVNVNKGFSYLHQELDVGKIRYASSNSSVLTVTENGTATVKGNGKYTLTVFNKNTEEAIIKLEDSVGHSYSNNCDTDCDYCGEARTVLHSYGNATCTAPSACIYCGITQGEPLGHIYTDHDDTVCNRCPYERAPGVTKGDINGDGQVSGPDLAMLKIYLSGASSLSDIAMLAADITEDGKVNGSDLALLKLFLAGATTL